ncbi:MAG TPA: nitrite/sulfite reductase [Egibacteraceae bacterium]|nr:nitrite/sulfite reductase [Egibacteraceae bacterium]
MKGPDIPAAKRAGLPVDLDRLTADGDAWLSPEERYALKMHGVCAQAQAGVFMIRVRVPGGRLPAGTARGVARVAERHGRGWVHLTTRQQFELHHVAARDVTAVLAAIADLGLTTSSTCGHTMRNVMACADAGVGLDEPFDCLPDARAVSDAVLARSADLNCRLPSRVNIAFGGCPPCRDHARVNDAGFVSTVREDGALGYELFAGGSAGKAPFLAVPLEQFVPRHDAVAAAEALVEVFAAHGDVDRPAKGRMKFLIRDLGELRFAELFAAAYDGARGRPRPAPAPVAPADDTQVAAVLACAPPGGWSSGVRPQRTPGRALVTVAVPLGDVDGEDLRMLARLAEELGDATLYLTRNQNVALRDVALEAVPHVRQRLASCGLGVRGADQASDVRACTGGPVCALAITPAQSAGAALAAHPALARNTGLRVHVSGCPNSCAQHQIADLGFSGGKVTVGGSPVLGYQVWLGGDVPAGVFGRVVGRVAEADVPAITEAVTGIWEALRHRGETLSQTVNRLGVDAFKAHIDALCAGRWAPGPEPAHAEPDRSLPLVGVA